MMSVQCQAQVLAYRRGWGTGSLGTHTSEARWRQHASHKICGTEPPPAAEERITGQFSFLSGSPLSLGFFEIKVSVRFKAHCAEADGARGCKQGAQGHVSSRLGTPLLPAAPLQQPLPVHLPASKQISY